MVNSQWQTETIGQRQESSRRELDDESYTEVKNRGEKHASASPSGHAALA